MKNILPFFLLILLILINCDEDNPVKPIGTIPSLSNITTPDTLYTVSTFEHFLSVRVEDPQGIDDIAHVMCTIFPSGNVNPADTIELNDDGLEGDIIPDDGIFYAPINADFAQGQAGDYLLTFKAIDQSNNETESDFDTLTVIDAEENAPPIIFKTFLPDTFDINQIYNTFLVSAVAFDPQQQDNISFVMLQIFSPTSSVPSAQYQLMDDGQQGDVIAGDRIFSRDINVSFANEKVGKYSFHFQTFDSHGTASQAVVKVVNAVRSDNEPPIIFDLVAPDTTKLPTSGEVLIDLQIAAVDSQGFVDIREVLFKSYKPDGTGAQGNPFYMEFKEKREENGVEIGIYSLTIKLLSTNTPGDYTFIFEAVDLSDARSNPIEHVITVTK